MATILIVDDEEEYRELMLTALGDAGYKALGAENGTRGLELARTHAPDLILCDLMMPGLNGYATLAALKEDPVTAAIPVVFMTVISDASSKEHARSLGAIDYIEKPLRLKELFAIIEAKLNDR